MIRFLEYKLQIMLSSSKMRTIFLLIFGLFLGGCEKDNDTSLGEDGNIQAQSACWQTAIVHAVTHVVDTLYSGSSSKVAEGGASVILVGFSVWMALKLLKVLSSFKEESLGEVWTEITQKLFVCAFCAYFVASSGTITEAINMFVIPVYNAVLELGITALSVTKESGSNNLGDYGTISYSHKLSACKMPSSVSAGALMGAIQPISDCIVCAISDRLNAGVQIGIKLIMSLHLGAMLVGIALLILFTAAKFGFVLFLVDSLFRLNFAAFLLPVLIVGVPFNYTRKWSKHGFLMFINSAGIMLFLGLLISLSVCALETLMSKLTFDEANIEGLGPMLLAMLLISTLLVNIPGFGVTLADKFIGGGAGLEFQKKISRFVINTIRRAASYVAGTVTGGISSTLNQMVEKYEITRAIKDGVKQTKGKIDSALNSLAGDRDD